MTREVLSLIYATASVNYTKVVASVFSLIIAVASVFPSIIVVASLVACS